MSPLDYLDQQFKEAIKSRHYLGPAKRDQKKLEHTSAKVIRLAEVFKRASQQIENFSKGHNFQNKDIFPLRALLEDGKEIFERYSKSTKRWSRWFLKGLARYTPSQLKRFLPSCFSNQMENAEKETFDAFKAYQNLIQLKLDYIQKNQDIAETKDDFFNIFTEDDIIDEDKTPSIVNTQLPIDSIQLPPGNLIHNPPKKEIENPKQPHQVISPPQFGEQVDLKGWPITDTELNNWIKDGLFSSVKALDLEGCSNLTTDILSGLSMLPSLTKLSLPDLLPGKSPLKNLPKFDNPFKIKMFYLSSKSTESLVSQLYTGPQIWAAVFQIPLARQGVANIFPASQTKLDPKSIAYWLHENDYLFLTPQKSITTILADTDTALTDENLVEFVQKFPNATTLSLYRCPHITEKGIIQLLNTCPKIKTLDLEGCIQFKENLLLEKGSFDLLNKLNRLILTGTGINPGVIEAFKELMGKKLVFKEALPPIPQDDIGSTTVPDILSPTGFNQQSAPLFSPIDLNQQLKDCIAYHEKKTLASDDEKERKELKQLAASYIHNRIAVELFCGQDSARKIIEENIETASEEFCDLTLFFKEKEEGIPFELPLHRDVLYFQSSYFLKGLRQGGSMNQKESLTITNSRINRQAAQIVKDLFYGIVPVTNDWEIGAAVAELIGPNYFNHTFYYKTLLKSIHSQFTLERAEKMFISANLLKDEEGKKIYTKKLCTCLENWCETTPKTKEEKEQHVKTFQTIKNLSELFDLTTLKEWISLIQPLQSPNNQKTSVQSTVSNKCPNFNNDLDLNK